MEEKLNKLNGILVEVVGRVSGMKEIRNGRRKVSEWWNEELGI